MSVADQEKGPPTHPDRLLLAVPSSTGFSWRVRAGQARCWSFLWAALQPEIPLDTRSEGIFDPDTSK